MSNYDTYEDLKASYTDSISDYFDNDLGIWRNYATYEAAQSNQLLKQKHTDIRTFTSDVLYVKTLNDLNNYYLIENNILLFDNYSILNFNKYLVFNIEIINNNNIIYCIIDNITNKIYNRINLNYIGIFKIIDNNIILINNDQ